MGHRKGVEILMQFKMSVGDWSDDGHGKCDYFVVKTDAPDMEAVSEAYKQAVKLTGVRFKDVICAEYEDSVIHKEHKEKLEKHGINVAQYSEEADEVDEINLCPENYAKLTCDFLALGSTFKFKVLTGKQMPTFNSGGYGLFAS